MDWDPHFLARSPIFEPLRPRAPAFGPEWPGLAGWQQAFDAREPPVCNVNGKPLRLVPPGRKSGAFEEKYEARTYLAGELEARPENWHDCFNALVWLAFPLTKAALNARHYHALREQQAARRPNRGPAQDALTLFDEGGVIAAACDGELPRMVRTFRWKELFWTHRERLCAGMRFLVFGHALYEKALSPFIGVTGRAILLETEPGLLSAPIASQVAALDARLARHVSDPQRLQATRELEVLPVLGVPGWCAANERESFYDDTDYFRPGRRPGEHES